MSPCLFLFVRLELGDVFLLLVAFAFALAPGLAAALHLVLALLAFTALALLEALLALLLPGAVLTLLAALLAGVLFTVAIITILFHVAYLSFSNVGTD